MSVAADSPPIIVNEDKDRDEVKSSAVADTTSHRSLLTKVAGIVLVLGLCGGFLGAWVQSRLMRRPDTVRAPLTAQAPVPAPQPTPSPLAIGTPGVTEIVVQAGDSLNKLAQQYQVPEQATMDLNPTIQRWVTIQVGQKVFVPATPVPTSAPATSTTATPGND